jgi:hypothetical protein
MTPGRWSTRQITGFVPTGFVRLSDVERRLGLSRVALGRRLRESGVPVYRNPADKRVHLLREADADTLAEPQLISR